MLTSTTKKIAFNMPSQSITLLAKICLLSFSTLSFSNTIMAEEITIKTTPIVINKILINPDIGITDYHSFDIKNDPWWNQPTHPETSVVYFRWYWEELEPQKGQYNFKLIDDTINQAAALDKKIVIRFMTMAGKNDTHYNPSPNAGKKILGIPCWLKSKIDENTIDGICADDNSYIVDYKNSILKKNLQRFLMAMGNRYNNNEHLLRLDVGLVGSWGEWNLATHKEFHSTLGFHGYTDKDLLIYPKMLAQAFPNKTLTMPIGSVDENILGYTTKRHYGWRADCLGDWEPNWNHMENSYPDTIKHTLGLGNTLNTYPDKNFLSRWKEAPVDFEICYTMEDWAKKPDIYTEEKVKQTFDDALNMHISLLNLKSGYIPQQYQPLLNDFLKKVGYRFELNMVEITSTLIAGSPIIINSSWKNTGVAPSYNNYPVVWRLRDQENNIVTYFDTKNDIRRWIPANNHNETTPTYKLKNIFTLPKNIIAGNYFLDVALVTPNTHNGAIKLAIEGMKQDKWHQINSIYLMNSD